MVSVMAAVTIFVGFMFAFINGFHDGCNVLASSISSRSILPKKALFIACTAEFTGALILGTAVAETIGIIFVLSTLLGGIIWNLATWKYGIPSSSSHALIGGLLGAGVFLFGWHSVNWTNILFRVVIVMFTSPIIGFSIGYFFIKLALLLFKNCSKDINDHLKKVQNYSMFFLGISHGSSDSQKSMGLIALVLLVLNGGSEFYIPLWVKLGCAAAITAGLSVGGWNTVKSIATAWFTTIPSAAAISALLALIMKAIF